MDRMLEQRTMAKISWQLLPLIVVLVFPRRVRVRIRCHRAFGGQAR